MYILILFLVISPFFSQFTFSPIWFLLTFIKDVLWYRSIVNILNFFRWKSILPLIHLASSIKWATSCSEGYFWSRSWNKALISEIFGFFSLVWSYEKRQYRRYLLLSFFSGPLSSRHSCWFSWSFTWSSRLKTGLQLTEILAKFCGA